jgi:hypothetical protein
VNHGIKEHYDDVRPAQPFSHSPHAADSITVACLPADRREHQWQCYLAQHYFQFCATLAVMRDEKPSVNADAKFGIGELLYNRNTKEDGRVTRVYEFEGSVMYEVSRLSKLGFGF